MTSCKKPLFEVNVAKRNAVAERGFSAMGAVHSKQRSEMGHEQVWAHMMIQFNGSQLSAYA